MNKLVSGRQSLRQSGYRATTQRLAVLRGVDEFKSQFTPQELYQYLKEKHPGIGLVTVYRSLKLLSEAGLVCQMGRLGHSQSYAPRSPQHHDHLVCTGCNRVVDFAGCKLSRLAERLAQDTGFAIKSHQLEFMGLCQECRREAGIS